MPTEPEPSTPQGLDLLTNLARVSLGEALAGLEQLCAQVPAWGDPAQLAALGRALPATLAPLPPELGLALAELARVLGPHVDALPRDLDALEPELRLAWVRVASRIDAKAAARLDEATLASLIQLPSWALAELADPLAVARGLARAESLALRLKLPTLLGRAVRDLALDPDAAFGCLAPLLADPHPRVRAGAFAQLRSSWAEQLAAPLARERDTLILAGLDDADADVAELALGRVAALGKRQALTTVLDDEDRAPGLRAAALEALAPVAEREDLEIALTLGLGDPLQYAASARRFVLAAHRHGLFIDAALVELALEAFDQHWSWTAEELIRVTYIARHELVARLAELPLDDSRWPRRAAVLGASIGTGAHETLAELLRRSGAKGSEVPDETRLALVEAAAASPEFDDEDALLAQLARVPEAVIAALRVKGGRSAAAALEARVVHPRCPQPLRAAALPTLWAISEEREALLERLATALGPHHSGLLDGRFAARRDPIPARIHARAPWPDDNPSFKIETRTALEHLCESGEPRHDEAIVPLFRRLYAAVVQRAIEGEFAAKRTEHPELEQLLYRHGRHLVSSGRSVRGFASPAPETGRDFVLAVLITWLREHPEAPLRVALLESIARHEPRGPHLRLFETAWRDPDPSVQRAALEALIAAGEDARGLELSIGRLSAASDARVVVQALDAIARLGASWAEGHVIAALEHPNMSVKQGAAEALAVIGSPRCLAAVVGWLARHDNTGLRRRLLATLDAVAGDTAPALLVHALVGPAERNERREALLREALDGRLSLAALVRLARAPAPVPVIKELVDAAARGDFELLDASRWAVLRTLHRLQLDPSEAVELDAIAHLRIEGFSPARVLALVESKAAVLDKVRALRTVFGPCLTWLSTLEDPPAEPIELLVAANTVMRAAHVDALLGLVERCRARLSTPVLVDLLEDRPAALDSPGPKARLLGLLRTLPAGPTLRGPRRWSLLDDLDALRTRADLDTCLRACQRGPDLVADSIELLTAALRLPFRPRDSEPDPLAELREGVAQWHRKPEPEATAWLDLQLEQRPLGVPIDDTPLPAAEVRRPKPPAAERLARARAWLAGEDPQLRQKAAQELLSWPGARELWPEVCARFVAGQLELDAAALRHLARSLDTWPREATTRPQGRALVHHLDRTQRRRFLPQWIAAWIAGTSEAGALLRSVGQDLLIPHARVRAESGDYALVELLRRDASTALAELIAFVQGREPERIAHLQIDEGIAPEDDQGPPDIHDPLAALDRQGLVDLIRRRDTELGLAVRAVHALGRRGPASADAIEALTLDPRPRVRSAALRTLRKLVAKPRSLAAAAAVLEIETRRDAIRGLVASLGHGRHLPSAPVLLEYTLHRDRKIRETAMDVLRGWGPEVIPVLRRHARRARADRRRSLEAFIDELA